MRREAEAGKDWVPARLIPTAGIRGQEEQEKRATSALLAVLPAVPDFGHALLSGMGAPKGRIATFTEVRLKDEAGKTHIPAGAVVVERGRTRWSCLVEVKTSRVALDASQVDRYLSIARQHGFDGLLTISNQIRTDPDALPRKRAFSRPDGRACPEPCPETPTFGATQRNSEHRITHGTPYG